ncbi:MAG: alpha/beta hydrolase [Alphaproteobacteria bacterium]|nr:alpha/beta hydrolase [Alphaproteobacteria bacterium]
MDGETFTYAFMDHRGYGLSRETTGEYTAKEAAEDAAALADALGWDQFHVIGHSMSGMVAQRLTLDARERVKSILAVCPGPATGVPLDTDGEALFKGAVTEDEKWKMASHMVTGSRLSENWHNMELGYFRSKIDTDACLGFLRMWTEPR